MGAELSVTWQAGVFVRDAEPQGLDALAAGAKAERVFLSLLAEFTEQGRYVSATPSVTYAPALFAKHPKSEGCTKRSLASAMEALLSRGTIVIGQHGTGSKARSHIEKAGCNPPGNAECNEGATPRATLPQPPATGGRHSPLIPLALHPPSAAGCTQILMPLTRRCGDDRGGGSETPDR